MNQLENWLAPYFEEKAPRLPDSVREVLVKIAPWLVLIGVVFSLPAVLSLLGFGAFFGPWMMWGRYMMGGNYYLSLILSLVIIILEIIALPGLFHRARRGWLFAFYALLVSGLQNLLPGNIVGLILCLLIGFYILFQVRSSYH